MFTISAAFEAYVYEPVSEPDFRMMAAQKNCLKQILFDLKMVVAGMCVCGRGVGWGWG